MSGVIPDDPKGLSLMDMFKAAAEAHQSMQLSPRRQISTKDSNSLPVRKQAATLPMTNNAGGSAPPLTIMKRIDPD
jgi:hypothetical protein